MSSVAPGARGTDVLLERAAELSTLVECLEAVARSSRGQILFVGDEAGVGTTNLVRHVPSGRSLLLRRPAATR